MGRRTSLLDTVLRLGRTFSLFFVSAGNFSN